MKRFDFYGDNARAYNSREPEILLAGPAGTGKSVVLLAKCLTLLDKYPGCRGLFCRGTRASLTQSGLVTWEQDVLGPDHKVLLRNPCKRRVRQSYEFPNGSEFVVAGLDDPGKTLSSQYDFIYIQEATEEGVDDNVYQTLTRCLRNGRTPFTQVMSDCNPTTPIHWLYKRQGVGKKLRMYSSTHRDNPAYWDRGKGEWTPLGRSYIEGTLKAMTGTRRARFYEGKWQAAEGLVFDGFIHRQFDDPEPGHLLPAGWRPPDDWPRVWSLDWGFTSPLVLQFWAVDCDRRMYRYREFYQTRIRAEAVGEWAKQEIESGREPRPRGAVCDHDPLMKAEFERGSGIQLELADKKDLLAGIQVTQERFDFAGDGRPRIFVADGAVVEVDQSLADAGRPTSFVEELGAYIWDTNSVIDRPLDRDNHAADAARYAVRWVDANLGGPAPTYGTDYGDPHAGLASDTFN